MNCSDPFMMSSEPPTIAFCKDMSYSNWFIYKIDIFYEFSMNAICLQSLRANMQQTFVFFVPYIQRMENVFYFSLEKNRRINKNKSNFHKNRTWYYLNIPWTSVKEEPFYS